MDHTHIELFQLEAKEFGKKSIRSLSKMAKKKVKTKVKPMTPVSIKIDELQLRKIDNLVKHNAFIETRSAFVRQAISNEINAYVQPPPPTKNFTTYSYHKNSLLDEQIDSSLESEHNA